MRHAERATATVESASSRSATVTDSRRRGARRRKMRRTVQEESLHQMHAELLHRLEFLGALDALGDHLRAVVVREPHHRLDEILLDEIRVDRVDQRDVELDEVRLEVGDRAEAGVAAARVVDREAEAALAEDARSRSRNLG